MVVKRLLGAMLIVGMATTCAYANSIDLRVDGNRNALSVEISLTNEDTLSGMQIPLDLHYSRLGLQVDSVSFVGTRCQGFMERFYRVIPEEDKVFIYLVETADPSLNSSPLLPGTGEIATIYLTRVGPPQIDNWRITNERINDDLRDLRFLIWTNQAIEVPCIFNGAAGVEELRLGQDYAAASWGQSVQFDQRNIPDGAQYILKISYQFRLKTL